MQEIKEGVGVSSQLPDLLRQPSTFSEKCFRDKVRGRRMSETLAFLHPDESIFQGSKFQFPPDYVPRALSVHEKLWCQRKLILTPFPTPELLRQFPFENCGLFFLPFFSCCVQLPPGYLSAWFLPAFRCKSVVCNGFRWL